MTQSADGEPCNIEAEQAVIAASIVSPDMFWTLSELVSMDHFSQGLHQRMWSALASVINMGRPPTPAVLMELLSGDPALQEIGGVNYLNRLAASGFSVISPRTYAEIVRDNAQKRALLWAARSIIESVQTDDTADEMIERAEARLYQLRASIQTGPGLEAAATVVERTVQAALKAHQDPEGARVMTGINALDELIGGLFPKDLAFLGGATSMGKTGLAQCVGLNVATAGRRVAAFSLEMGAEEWMARHIAQLSRVPTDRMETGKFSDDEFRRIAHAQREIGALPYHVDGSSRLSVAQIRSRALRLKRGPGLDLIIVDHLQFIRGEDKRATEIERLTQIVPDLKAMAKDLSVPVLCISHLNREHQKRADHRPIPSDLYGSGAIEKDADVLIFVHREEYFLEMNEPTDQAAWPKWNEARRAARGLAEIICAKRRRGKARTKTIVAFDETFTTFRDRETDDLGI